MRVFANAFALDYTLNYNYSTSNPHQLEDVLDSKNSVQSNYLYNSSGSIKEIQDPMAGGPQTFYWNEEQWLSGVSNDLGVHHYVYDHKGERVMKSSVLQSSVQVNDQNIDDVQYLEPYSIYVNPYYVVTDLLNGDKVSKHYYMNTQRVATDISISYTGNTPPPIGPQKNGATPSNPSKPSTDPDSPDYNAAFADLQETLEQLGHKPLDLNRTPELPTLESYYPELVKEDRGVMSVAKNSPESTTRVIFWYHPDYLGNVDLVTKRGGYAHEYFQYNPWGEEMHQWNANIFSFSSPYRFNSKELDQETGLHYYGARYYQSKLSLWMSVDPLAHETPEPYAFTGNNPVNKVDPDGRKADFWPWLKNLFNRTKPEQCSNFKVDRARRSKVQWRKNRNMIAFKKAAKAAGRFIYSQQQVVEDHWETVIDINLTYPDGPFDSLDPESKYRVIFEKEDKAMYWDDKWKMRTFSGPRTIQIPKGTIDWYGQYENSPDKPRLERRTYYQTKGVQIMGILVWLDKKNISRSFTNPKRRPKPKTVKGNRIRRNYRRNNN